MGLIGLLFVLLAADVRLADMAGLGAEGLLTVARPSWRSSPLIPGFARATCQATPAPSTATTVPARRTPERPLRRSGENGLLLGFS